MPSSTNDRSLKTGLAVLSVLVLAYSLLIVQQILLGVLAIAMLWGLYLFYRLVLVLARIASSLEQLTYQRADGGASTRPRDADEHEVATDVQRDPEREY